MTGVVCFLQEVPVLFRGFFIASVTRSGGQVVDLREQGAVAQTLLVVASQVQRLVRLLAKRQLRSAACVKGSDIYDKFVSVSAVASPRVRQNRRSGRWFAGLAPSGFVEHLQNN